MEEKILKNRKLLIIITTLVFVGLILFGVISYIINYGKTSTIEILVAPSSAKIEIDHKTYKNRKTSKITPGNKTATITANGFISQTVNLDFQDNETTKLYVILEPDANNKNWYNDHPEDNTIANIVSDYLVTQEQNEYLSKYPIVSILPIQVVEVNPTTYDWTEFRIDYGKFKECKTEFCLKITDSTGNNKERALQEIHNRGFNPDEYEIIYTYQPLEALPQ